MDWRKSSKSRCFRSSRDKNIVLIQSFVKRERDLSRREYIDLFNSSPGKRRSITIETKPFVELENRRKFHLISCRRKVNLRSSFSDRRFVFVIFRTDRGRRLFVNWKNKSSEFSRMKQSSMKFSIRRKRRKKISRFCYFLRKNASMSHRSERFFFSRQAAIAEICWFFWSQKNMAQVAEEFSRFDKSSSEQNQRKFLNDALEVKNEQIVRLSIIEQIIFLLAFSVGSFEFDFDVARKLFIER